VAVLSPLAGAGETGVKPVARAIPPGTTVLRLNPAFTVRRLDKDAVEISTQRTDGSRLRTRFSGVDADLVELAAGNQTLNEVTRRLGERRSWAETRSREAVQKKLPELLEARVVYCGDKMLVKVVPAEP
jgi:hypothetical protein